MKILIIATPNFNLAATANFIDPFRAINYLDGASHFHWTLASVGGGMCEASNGLSVATQDLKSALEESWDLAIVSSSWAPERHSSSAFLQAMRRVARSGCVVGALDTGSFILARAGLLNGRIATTHYEHIDALMELYPAITVVEELFVFDGNRITCCGGAASIDFSLHIIEEQLGATRATNAARYLYHQSLRPVGARQVPEPGEPLGSGIPNAVRQAIEVMESHLENIVTIPDICEQIGVSQRQLDRLFATYVKKTPARYYRDVRLDRARGLVTQTDMPLSGVAVAAGFASQVHFSRAYKQRFGLPPKQDRIEGRIPFEYRARPMHKMQLPKESRLRPER